MALENSLNTIREHIVNRYGDNLAALLLFGSANTGNYKEGKSDIDTLIFIKEKGNLDFGEEIGSLVGELSSEKLAVQNMETLEGVKKYIQENNGWGVYTAIMAKGGSRTLHSTGEFEELKKELKDNPFKKQGISNYLQRKLETDVNGYFKKLEGWDVTKAFFSHTRRLLQMTHYLTNGELIFDYHDCLKELGFEENETKNLKQLARAYDERRVLSDEEKNSYNEFSEKLTKGILK